MLCAEMADVWARSRLCLTEFVRNANLDVRRSIIPQLKLDETLYSPELRTLVKEAIEIGRAGTRTNTSAIARPYSSERSIYITHFRGEAMMRHGFKIGSSGY